MLRLTRNTVYPVGQTPSQLWALYSPLCSLFFILPPSAPLCSSLSPCKWRVPASSSVSLLGLPKLSLIIFKSLVMKMESKADCLRPVGQDAQANDPLNPLHSLFPHQHRGQATFGFEPLIPHTQL